MAAPADRMKAMRARRRASGLREIRLLAPDMRKDAVRREFEERLQSSLDPAVEGEALRWIEAVSEFHNPPRDDPFPPADIAEKS